MKISLTLFTLLLLASVCCGQQAATIEGNVRDGKTGQSMGGVKVDVYTSEDHVNVIATTHTDDNGYYSVQVAPGRYYDIYLRIGDVNPNQRTNSVVEPRGVYTLNFNIATESSYSSGVVEKYGFGVVVAVAGFILLLILVDQLVLRKSIREPTLSELKKQRQQIEEMTALTKAKYHRREIDEESYREITRDQQEKLIELESKIRELEGK